MAFCRRYFSQDCFDVSSYLEDDSKLGSVINIVDMLLHVIEDSAEASMQHFESRVSAHTT